MYIEESRKVEISFINSIWIFEVMNQEINNPIQISLGDLQPFQR